MNDAPQAHWINIPNLLSLSRLALLPVWWWVMASPDHTQWWWGGALIAYGLMSDALDGYLARRLHQVTTWGRVFDPLGDKIAAAVIGIFCVVHRGLPLTVWLMTTVRDIVLIAGGWIRYRRSGAIPVSMNLGRYLAFSWGIVLLLYAFDAQPYAGILTWPVAVAYFLAGFAYWRHREARPAKAQESTAGV